MPSKKDNYAIYGGNDMSNIKDITASVQARLKNLSKTHGVEFDYMLSRYGIERFLYRLSLSKHNSSFILKGASLFTVWIGPAFRTTKDADFLCSGNAEPDYLVKCFKEICSIKSNDGLVFDLNTIRIKDIRLDQQYGGTCIMITAMLGRVRIPLQFDMAFGDSTYPGVETIEYPAMLDMERAKIQSYPVYTVIAEKFEAMVSLDLANSRMKDFYDIWLITELFDLDYSILQTTMEKTFERRGTKFPNNLPTALTEVFYDNDSKQTQWKAFIRKIKPQEYPDSLKTAVIRIKLLIEPLINDALKSSYWEAVNRKF